MDNTADFQRVLHGLKPDTHRNHTIAGSSWSGYIVRCPKCIADDKARLPIADALRRFSDGWGVLDMDLVMTDLAMQVAAGNFPEFLRP